MVKIQQFGLPFQVIEGFKGALKFLKIALDYELRLKDYDKEENIDRIKLRS